MNQLDLEDSVIFIGGISYTYLNKYYNLCDIFVMPSKSDFPNVEGFGIVFLEANACEKPVVGSKSGGIPSAIVDGKTGFLVEEKNSEQLYNVLDNLLSNEELSRKMGENGRKHIMNNANWDVAANKIINEMKQIM